MTDYRRPKQTNKDRMVDSTSRGLEGLLAILAQRGQLVPNAMAKFGPSYQDAIDAIDATSQGIGDMAAAGQDLRNSFYTNRNDLYGNIDQMSGLQGQADDMFASQQAASDQGYARGQREYARRMAIERANQEQAMRQQQAIPRNLIDLLGDANGREAADALTGGKMAVANLIAQLEAAGRTEEAAALRAMVASGMTGAKQQAQQGYDAARGKAADLIQQLMGN